MDSKNISNKKNKKIIIENNRIYRRNWIIKTFRYNDSFLRPPFSICKYDFMSGSEGSYTPLRYNISHRNYYLVL